MKKIVLSAITALTISTVASASGVQLYTDANGQVFTTAGEGRTAIVSEETSLFSKASKLQFSGLHYLGYTYRSTDDLRVADVTANGIINPPTTDSVGENTGKFEMRRNYFEARAFLFDNPKSYARITMDFTDIDGYYDVVVKYAYLYLDNILPSTGVEFGQVHRPWLDYEEHSGWLYRAISKTAIEAKETADLTNSADLGINFKTKTDYFTSEIGLFNGEGYHGSREGGDNTSPSRGTGAGNSLEWRFTAAMLGDGKKHRHAKKDTWFDASFWGQYNVNNAFNIDANGGLQTYSIYGLHAVYNMPSFLLSAQYFQADNDLKTTYNKNGSGYSVNATYRFGQKLAFELFGRVDGWTAQQDYKDDLSTNNYIYGLGWEQNKNLTWFLDGQSYKATDHGNFKGDVAQDYNAALVTAQVSW